MTIYCNKDDNMRFCSVEMKDSTEQNLIPPVGLQYHCLDRSLRYVDLTDSLNSERNPGCCYSKNDFATGRRVGYGVRTVIIWNLRRWLAASKGSQHRRSDYWVRNRQLLLAFHVASSFGERAGPARNNNQHFRLSNSL